MRFHPLVQNSSHYFSRIKRICATQTLTSTEHHISSLYSHFWVELSAGSSFLVTDNVSTSSNSGGSLWWLTCIEHQIWGLPSLFWPYFYSGSQFLSTAKKIVSCDLFIAICRVATYGSAHQYKLPDNISTHQISEGSLGVHAHTRKMVHNTGRASSFLVFLEFSKTK